MVALLERTDEIDALTSAVRGAGRGRGSVVLVSGEAGIGKTSLVRAFTERVAGPVRLLVDGCDDLVTARPLGPLRDAAAGSAGPLEVALGAGGDVFAAVVDELSGPRVTAVVVEDLHWADDATLDVLGYLARWLAELPAVLVLTYRDDAAPTHPMHRLLGSLIGGPVVRLPLRSLSSAAVVGLAAGSRWDPDQLLTLTGGNPFYLTEALAATGPGVPASVSDAVLARVARLDDAARAAVEQLSVVPTMVELDLAQHPARGAARRAGRRHHRQPVRPARRTRGRRGRLAPSGAVSPLGGTAPRPSTCGARARPPRRRARMGAPQRRPLRRGAAGWRAGGPPAQAGRRSRNLGRGAGATVPAPVHGGRSGRRRRRRRGGCDLVGRGRSARGQGVRRHVSRRDPRTDRALGRGPRHPRARQGARDVGG